MRGSGPHPKSAKLFWTALTIRGDDTLPAESRLKKLAFSCCAKSSIFTLSLRLRAASVVPAGLPMLVKGSQQRSKILRSEVLRECATMTPAAVRERDGVDNLGAYLPTKAMVLA